MFSPGGLARLRAEDLRLSLMGHGAPIVRYEVDVGDARFPSSARKRTSTAPALSLMTRPLEYDAFSPDLSQIASPYDATSSTFPCLQTLPTSQSMELPFSDNHHAQPQREINYTPRRSRRHSLNGPDADELIRAPNKLKRKAVPRLNTRDGEDLRMVSADSQGRLRVLEPSTSMMTTSSSGALTTSSSGPMLSMGQSSSSGSLWSSSLGTPMMQASMVRGFAGAPQAIGSPDVFASPTIDDFSPTFPFGIRSESGGFAGGGKDKSKARLMRSGQVWNLAQLDVAAAAAATELSEQSPKSLHPLLSPTFVASSTPNNRIKSTSPHDMSPSEFKLTPPPPPHDEMVSEVPGSPSPARHEKRRPSSLIADRSLISVEEDDGSHGGRESFEGESFYALQKFTPGGSPSSRHGDGYFQSRKGSAASGQVGSPLARYARNDSQDLQGVFAAHITHPRPPFLDALRAMENESQGMKAISFAKTLRSKLSRDNLLGENTSLRAKGSKENLRGDGRSTLLKGSRDDSMVQGGLRGLRQTRSKENLLSMGGAGFLGTKRSRDDLRGKSGTRPIISHPLASDHRRSRSIPVASMLRNDFPEADFGVAIAETSPPTSAEAIGFRRSPDNEQKPGDVDLTNAQAGNQIEVAAMPAHVETPLSEQGYRSPSTWNSVPAKLNRMMGPTSTPHSPLRSEIARDHSEAMDSIATPPARTSEASAKAPFSPVPGVGTGSLGLSKRSAFSTPHSLHLMGAAPGNRESTDDDASSYSSAGSIDRLQDVAPRELPTMMTEPKLASFDAGHTYSLRLDSSSPQRRSFRPAIEQRPSTSGSAKSLTAQAFQTSKSIPGQDPRRLSVTVTPGPRRSEDSSLFAASSSVNTLEGFEISAESLQETAQEAARSASVAQFQAAPPAFRFPSPPPSERPFSTASMQERAQAVMLRFPSPPPVESGGEQNEDASQNRDASRYIDGRGPGKIHNLSMMSVLEEASGSGEGEPTMQLTTAALAAHDAGIDDASDASATTEFQQDMQMYKGKVFRDDQRRDSDAQSVWSQAVTAQETVKDLLASPHTPRVLAAETPTTPGRTTEHTPQIAIESPHGTRYRNGSASSEAVMGLALQPSSSGHATMIPTQSPTSQDPLSRVKGFPTTFSSYDTSPKTKSSPSFSPRSNPMQSPLQDARAQYKPLAPLSIRTRGEDMRLRPLQQMTDDGMLSAKSTTSFGLSSPSQSSMGDELSERYAVNETWRDVVCGCFGRMRTYKP